MALLRLEINYCQTSQVQKHYEKLVNFWRVSKKNEKENTIISISMHNKSDYMVYIYFAYNRIMRDELLVNGVQHRIVGTLTYIVAR